MTLETLPARIPKNHLQHRASSHPPKIHDFGKPCRSTSISPWNTSHAATFAIGCEIQWSIDEKPVTTFAASAEALRVIPRVRDFASGLEARQP